MTLSAVGYAAHGGIAGAATIIGWDGGLAAVLIAAYIAAAAGAPFPGSAAPRRQRGMTMPRWSSHCRVLCGCGNARQVVMTVIVYGDFNCPYSYLASQRADELNRTATEMVGWRAVEHDRGLALTGTPSDRDQAAGSGNWPKWRGWPCPVSTCRRGPFQFAWPSPLRWPSAGGRGLWA